MAFVAEREKLPLELVRDEMPRAADYSGEINHPELEPMGIGIATRCKVNANIGNSAITSNIDEELRKLHMAMQHGADTVMDLSTGGEYSGDSRRDFAALAGADWDGAHL